MIHQFITTNSLYSLKNFRVFFAHFFNTDFVYVPCCPPGVVKKTGRPRSGTGFSTPPLTSYHNMGGLGMLLLLVGGATVHSRWFNRQVNVIHTRSIVLYFYMSLLFYLSHKVNF